MQDQGDRLSDALPDLLMEQGGFPYFLKELMDGRRLVYINIHITDTASLKLDITTALLTNPEENLLSRKLSGL